MSEVERRERKAGLPFCRSPTFGDGGIVLGFGTTLLRRSVDPSASPREAERTLCLLSLLEDVASAVHWLARFERALKCWDQGEKSLAHIHLAHTRLGPLAELDGWRLSLADALIDAGMTPRSLAKEMGFDLPPLELGKFDQNQPRNPAGSGRVSGQWTKAPTSVTASEQRTKAPTTAATGTEAYAPKDLVALARAPSVVDALAPEALDWLAGLAAGLAIPVAVFGLAMVYTPTTGPVASEGAMPGRPDLHYRIDPDTGRLTLTSVGDDDPSHALVSQLGPDGIYRDIITGVAIARAVGDHAVLIDPDRAAPNADTASDDDQPKLCPAPKPDRPGGRKIFDILYAQYVRNIVNPQRQPQLPPQLTFALPGDTPSGWVHFDDCRESDGTMIEAKGNYAGMMASEFSQDRLKEEWLKQAGRQVEASQGRPIEWYFNDSSAADLARSEFAGQFDKEISIHVLPYPGGVPNPNPRIR